MQVVKRGDIKMRVPNIRYREAASLYQLTVDCQATVTMGAFALLGVAVWALAIAKLIEILNSL